MRIVRHDFNAVRDAGGQVHGKDEFVTFGFVADGFSQPKSDFRCPRSPNGLPLEIEIPRIHRSIEANADFGEGIDSDGVGRVSPPRRCGRCWGRTAPTRSVRAGPGTFERVIARLAAARTGSASPVKSASFALTTTWGRIPTASIGFPWASRSIQRGRSNADSRSSLQDTRVAARTGRPVSQRRHLGTLR